MGGVGSSVGVKAAEKLSENTVQALESLKIPESARNLTETINKIVNPPGPFEFKVDLDLSQNVIELVEKFLYFVPISLFLILMLLLVVWQIGNHFVIYSNHLLI